MVAEIPKLPAINQRDQVVVVVMVVEMEKGMGRESIKFWILELGNWEISFALPERCRIILAKYRRFPNFPIPKFPNYATVMSLSRYTSCVACSNVTPSLNGR
jgi:hypothetical protein